MRGFEDWLLRVGFPKDDGVEEDVEEGRLVEEEEEGVPFGGDLGEAERLEAFFDDIALLVVAVLDFLPSVGVD